MGFSFVHAADLHLDSPMRGLERYDGAPVEAIRGATRRALENLVELAVATESAFVLLAGDLYDGDWQDYNTGLFFTRQMARLRDAGIPVIGVAGNHDAASRITRSLRLPDNVSMLSTASPETVRLDRVDAAVHGQGYATRAVADDLAARYPASDPGLFNVGLLHTSLDGRPGHDPYAPTRVDTLRTRGYDYWALGHVHAAEVVERDPWIVFPGNTQGRNAREAGARGCRVVGVDGGEVIAVAHHDLDVVRWAIIDVDASTARDLDEVLDCTRDALASATEDAGGRLLAARLRIGGASSAHGILRARSDAVVAECRSLACDVGGGVIWLERVEVRTTRAVPLAEALERDDAVGGLLRAVSALEAESDRVEVLSDELVDLATRLPSELRGGGRDPTTPAALADALEDVKEILLERLLDGTPPR